MICPNCLTQTVKSKKLINPTQSIICHVCPKCGFINPGNTFRITNLYAFVSVDKDDQEGVIGFQGPNGPMPMIGGDKKRMYGSSAYGHGDC